MGARFFLLILFFLSIQIAGLAAFISVAWGGTIMTSETGIEGLPEPNKTPLEELQTHEEGSPPTSVEIYPLEKEHMEKIQEILESTLKQVDDYNKKMLAAEQSWQAAQTTNSNKSRFNPLRAKPNPFDFTQVSLSPDPVVGLVISNLAALSFCRGKNRPADRALKHLTLSSSRIKRGIQTGVGVISKTQSPFVLPALTTEDATCDTIQNRFCTVVCSEGLCGANVTYGAACVKGCWGNMQLRTNKAIQQCYEEFTSRFLSGSAEDLLNQCAIKRQQRARQGSVRSLYSLASGEQEDFNLADLCAKAVVQSKENSSSYVPPLCGKLLQTCSLEKKERAELRLWAMQWQTTGKIPSSMPTPPVPTKLGNTGLNGLGRQSLPPIPPMMFSPMRGPVMFPPPMPMMNPMAMGPGFGQGGMNGGFGGQVGMNGGFGGQGGMNGGFGGQGGMNGEFGGQGGMNGGFGGQGGMNGGFGGQGGMNGGFGGQGGMNGMNGCDPSDPTCGGQQGFGGQGGACDPNTGLNC